MQTTSKSLSESHKTFIINKYGFDPDGYPFIWSVNPAEIEQLTSFRGVESPGIAIEYPNHPEMINIRLEREHPAPDGKTIKYIKPAGQENVLFIPPKADIAASDVIITEGEMKALVGSECGLNVVALSGIWNWRRSDASADYRLSDQEALISDLNRDWSGQNVTLLYDSDITSAHTGWPAYPRLAEQLYRLGAETVKITTIPNGG